jgi:hypothetical protein
MAEELSAEALIFLVVFLIATFWVVRLFMKLNREVREKTDKITEKMNELEREYVGIKPELAELRAMLDARVDYSFLEKKLHELVVMVMDRTKSRR